MPGAFASYLSTLHRLTILRLLVEAGGEAGESALERGVKLYNGKSGVTRESIQADLKHLRDVHCIEIDLVDDRVMIAAITKRGVSCAEGAIAVDGVAAPEMGR